jgi:hypothetical protein
VVCRAAVVGEQLKVVSVAILRLVGRMYVFGVFNRTETSNRYWKMNSKSRLVWSMQESKSGKRVVQPGVSSPSKREETVGNRTIVMDVQYAEKITVPL